MDDETARLLQAQLQRLHRRQRRERAAVKGLSSTAVRVLGALSRTDGPAQPGWLAEQLLMTTSNVAAALRELESAGHVARQRDTADGRRTNVTLTECGRRVVEEHRAVRAEWLRAAIEATLDEEEQALVVAAGELLARVAEYQPGQP